MDTCDFCGESCTCPKMDNDLAKKSEEKMKDVKVCDLNSEAGDCEACGS